MHKTNATVFLTVGTPQQKQLCEKMIVGYKEKYGVNIIVSADTEQGDRIGSGGALLQVIGRHYNVTKKMLVINSGGQSKRSVHCAVRGKALANIKSNGQTITLFEHILINALRLLNSFETGVLVCCSDILIDTKNISIAFDNNIGFCVPADIETGTRHGVMFHNDKNLLASYPHKLDAEHLRTAANDHGMQHVLIDTGVIYLNDAVCSTLHQCNRSCQLTEKLRREHMELNLYSDIIPLFSEDCTKQNYLQSDIYSPAQLQVRQLLFDLLSSFSLRVHTLTQQQFLHFGSLRESLTNTLILAKKTDSFAALNSCIEAGAVIEKNTVLDNAVIKAGCRIGKNCIVSDITLDSNEQIPDDHLVCGIKLYDGSYVTVLCGIDENPKQTIDDTSLWELPRFYKGKSFSDSLQKLTAQSDEEKYSIQHCIEHADYNYYHTRCLYISNMNMHSYNPAYTRLRDTIIENHLKTTPEIPLFQCKKDRIEIQLPVRVNLSGTWTDAMPYCIENGGQVINMAVLTDGEHPIQVCIEKLQEKRIEFMSDDACLQFDFSDNAATSDLSDFILHMAAVKSFGITAKTQLPYGFRLSTRVSGIDKGSGLGTSSILLAGCLMALAQITDTPYDTDKIMQTVFVAEQMMGTGGGWQDQVGGLFPALKTGTTQAGLTQIPQIQPIAVSSVFRRLFSERMILIPTGQRHFGRFIVSDVANRYLSADKDCLCAFRQLKELNNDMLNSLYNDDCDAFLHCINRHSALLKQISPLVTNERIEMLTASCLENIADAVSICGAGGGGYLLAFLKKGLGVADAQQFLTQSFPSVNGLVKKIDMAE